MSSALLVFPSFPRPREPVDDNEADGAAFEALGAPEVTKPNSANKPSYDEVYGFFPRLSATKNGMSSALSDFPPFTRPREPVDDDKADGADFEAPGAPEVIKLNSANKPAHGEVNLFSSLLSSSKRGMSSALSAFLYFPARSPVYNRGVPSSSFLPSPARPSFPPSSHQLRTPRRKGD